MAFATRADFDDAPFGISGLETALAVCAETLVVPGLLTWSQLIEKLSTNPARIAGGDGGSLVVGADADQVLIDPQRRWIVDPKQFVSKGRHSPFTGRTLTGAVTHTLCRGVEVAS